MAVRPTGALYLRVLLVLRFGHRKNDICRISDVISTLFGVFQHSHMSTKHGTIYET